MYSIARLPEDERRVLFRNAGQKMGMNEAIVEKDFWVCLTLDYLFHLCKWKDAFTFKGGTSLSKCYGIITRFSEDIDLILDWRTLGYSVDEPWEIRSNTKQDTFNRQIDSRAEIFLCDTLLPVLKQDLSDIIGHEAALHIDEANPQIIDFEYPHIFSADAILQTIRLEIGALAAWTPAIQKLITPYASACYPQAFQQCSSIILTAAAERTFWEKATILHQEANRPEEFPMPKRYSRHYYDLYCIAHSESRNEALRDLTLLQKVVAFKMKFYPRKWARYEDAVPSTIRLVPPSYRLDELRKDYEDMQEMIFGEHPSFDELMRYIRLLEREINHLEDL